MFVLCSAGSPVNSIKLVLCWHKCLSVQVLAVLEKITNHKVPMCPYCKNTVTCTVLSCLVNNILCLNTNLAVIHSKLKTWTLPFGISMSSYSWRDIKGLVQPKLDIESVSSHAHADGSLVKFHRAQNISGASPQNSVTAFSLTTDIVGELF